MSNLNNILAAIILYSLLSYILKLPQLFTGILFAIIGSQITIITPKKYKNTLLFIIPLSIVAVWYPSLMIPIIIGYLSAILIELLSKNGCRLLYPLSDITFTGPKNYLETGTKGDYAATTFLIVLTVITIILSTNGGEILDSINEYPELSGYLSGDDSSYSNYLYNNGSAYKQIININPAESLNENITTTTVNNTTTTIISEYTPSTTA